MFKNPPRIFAHKAVVDKGNFVLPDYILNKGDNTVNLFHRFCPHRMYPLHTPGEHVDEINCKFHNFSWSKDGTPLNNPKKIHCGATTTGRSGLVFKNFKEPDHSWVDELASETELVYSHSFQGESKGSWLWLMDIEADLVHVYKGGTHPILSAQINLDEIVMDQGNGWIQQNHPDGWWLYIFPFTFVEYGRPGCVVVQNIVPNNDTEYGFKWITQFYYAPTVTANAKILFEVLETVFREDVATAELQKGDYFPLMTAINRYEDHSVHFGKWVTENKIK